MAKKSSEQLVRQLGLFDSTMMMTGIVIGSGIFLTTGIMAKTLPSAGLILLAWIVGGLIVLSGSLTYAELGASLPEAGGQYVYLREAYGPLYGFLFGWKMFLVSMGGAIAALGAAFAEYFGYFIPPLSNQNLLFSIKLNIFNHSFIYNLSAGQLVAITVILLISAFNYIGAGLGKKIQNIFTVTKIGIILMLIIFCFTSARIIPLDLSLNPANLNIGQLFIGFGVALVAVFWAFDGWNNINYIAGEIKRPARNLPLSLIYGTLIITFIYVLTNIVYLMAMPIEEMSGVVRIAEKAAHTMYGKTAANILSAAVIISVFGALNGAIFVGPRVYYAMAKDKLFFRRAARIHPKFQTPSHSILLQACWASILTLSGSFEQLFTFTMFMNILFWIAAASSIFRLRKSHPHLPRPYKTWGYPVVPIIFIISLSGVLLNILIKKPVESMSGLFLAVIGIPVYYIWKKKYVKK